MTPQNVSKKSRSAMSAAQQQVRQQLLQVVDQATSIVNPLLRAGEESRNRIVEWFALVLKGNEPRAKGANQISIGCHRFVARKSAFYR